MLRMYSITRTPLGDGWMKCDFAWRNIRCIYHSTNFYLRNEDRKSRNYTDKELLIIAFKKKKKEKNSKFKFRRENIQAGSVIKEWMNTSVWKVVLKTSRRNEDEIGNRLICKWVTSEVIVQLDAAGFDLGLHFLKFFFHNFVYFEWSFWLIRILKSQDT